MAGLGKGLEALLSNSHIDVSSISGTDNKQVKIVNFEAIKDESLLNIPVANLEPSRYQPRQVMDNEALADLCMSIKQQGIIQPLLVRNIPGTEKFEILAGERRWRAAQKVGLSEVPVIVKKVEDRQAIAIAIIENMQRQNLNVIEESDALQRLAEEFGLTHEQIGEVIGKSRSQVSNLLRLSSLTDPVKRLVIDGHMEMGHARALLAITKPEFQQSAAEIVVKKNLSVRETENLVKRLIKSEDNTTGEKEKTVKDQNLIEWENRVKQSIGCSRVQLLPGSKGKGKLVLSYDNDQELEKLMSYLNR